MPAHPWATNSIRIGTRSHGSPCETRSSILYLPSILCFLCPGVPPVTRSSDNPNDKTICTNRKARHEYEILDQLECGVVLKGSEVKSLRDGKVSLDEAYARIRDGELWLVGCDIAVYPQASLLNHEPKRARKLLIHRRELQKFAEQAGHRGLTLIPLSLYFTKGKVKVKIAIARGKKLHDKRESLKKSEAQREIQRELSRRR
ncbi:MAG: SsrA-binding protein SmpB [Planctomycetia bacterium]|nr:SsrA-binding protein SmpB [Planctomycetia bacterium]